MKFTSLLPYVLVAAPLLAGCRTQVWSNDGRIVYQLNRQVNQWQTYVQSPIAKTHEAFVSGLKDLEVKPLTNQVDKVSALVDGFFADEVSFDIRLETVAPSVTRVRIRCGLVGDEQRALLLFKAMEKHL